MPSAWLRFREMVRTTQQLDIARLVQSGCQSSLPSAVRTAYDAPFPDETFKGAAKAMPDLVPTEPDDPASAANRTAWQRLSRWDRPFLVAFSDRDPITSTMAPVFQQIVPDAESVIITDARHFLQEDAADQLATAIARFATTQ
jgi:haloalkane dehalogenase